MATPTDKPMTPDPPVGPLLAKWRERIADLKACRNPEGQHPVTAQARLMGIKECADELEDVLLSESRSPDGDGHVVDCNASDDKSSVSHSAASEGNEAREAATTSRAGSEPADSLSHRCSGCGLRWDGPLKGAELCGDCWRRGQDVILKGGVPAQPAPVGTDPLLRLYNLVVSLAHPLDGCEENALEDEAHDIIRETRAGLARLRAQVEELKEVILPEHGRCERGHHPNFVYDLSAHGGEEGCHMCELEMTTQQLTEARAQAEEQGKLLVRLHRLFEPAHSSRIPRTEEVEKRAAELRAQVEDVAKQRDRAQLDARRAHPKLCPNCGSGLEPSPEGDVCCLSCRRTEAELRAQVDRLLEMLVAARDVLATFGTRAGYLPEQGGYSVTMTDAEKKLADTVTSIDRFVAAEAAEPLAARPEQP